MSARDSGMPQDDPDASWDELFENLPEPPRPIPTADNSAPAPGSRRAAREAANGNAASISSRRQGPSPEPSSDSVRASADVENTPTLAVPKQGTPATVPTVAPAAAEPWESNVSGRLDDVFTPYDDSDAPPKRKRRKSCLIALIVVFTLLGAIALAGVWVANTYGERIGDALGWGESKDWEPGLATGEAFVTIKQGDTGAPVSAALYAAGVTKTEDVFYDYLVAENDVVTFYPGVYRLQKKMTAAAALEALQDENNKIDNAVSVAEGATIASSLPSISETLGIPLADLEAAVKDPSQYGVEAQSLEGWLFPAVYTFDPDVTPTQVIQTMVDRTRESLDAAGVPAEDAQRVLTIASIIQREGLTADFPKVARVIQNRLDIDMKLQMDSTAQYGYGTLHQGVVSSSAAALEDPNEWNTYYHTGLPATPIASPSDAAIDAAMYPVDGPWLYFVTVNLATGETQFSETYDEHLVGVEKWRAWCRDNPDNSGCAAG